jgi:prevent-host-death family protein
MHVENINKARGRLGRLIQRAVAGEDIVIAHAGQPLVRLTPLPTVAPPRAGGQWHGKMRIAEDFGDFGPELEQLVSGEGE